MGSTADKSASPPERMTGARAVIRSLQELGVTDVFGMPGGAILPIYDEIFASSLNHILIRHEQGGGHAAEGYAHATGKVGVCFATSGPGATNLVTALADANMDSVPVLAITGQVGRPAMGTDAFQEADIVGATMPLTKHSFLVTNPQEIPQRIAEAYHLASTGRPGPVLVDIPKNIQAAEMDFSWPPTLDLPGYAPPSAPAAEKITDALDLIRAAKRPVAYVGGGVVRAGASAELADFIAATGMPVVTTLNARGAFPDSDPLNFGMPGMHGTVAAVGGLQRADLLVALGARFDDRVTGLPTSFAPKAKVIHVDIDSAEIHKIRRADVAVVADVKPTLAALSAAATAANATHGRTDLAAWVAQLNRIAQTYPLGWTATSDGLLAPQYVISRLAELVGPDGIFVGGVGQHQMWASQFLRFEKPRTWIASGGLGTMGFSLPAAMGAKVACPEREVWAIDGDGCFQMTNQELATCALNGIPIKVALINNSSLGMVRQWQTLFYDGRYSNTDLHTGDYVEQAIPDFVKLAEAYGCAALRVDDEAGVDDAIAQARAINDRPVVIDFRVSRDAMVWPMVAAGVSNDEIKYARDIAPVWDEEEAP
ncbi:acetolactate synthase large subunit [Buchananella hordeovulneris]|uniref:Acetolactate synthase n=1 Tax=Buchananella hordeovulneris TaxID=52770 RepID=A0A1Q5PVT2_9ACTO|nr:acetolactate synthase large subunit [Buchananella hordeovulneris]OKL51606.1 acetolactate synthase large subunit [Buchananella hordeovulneris]